MRRIGLLGGMSWESTAEYYRLINADVAARLGGLHSARVILGSVDLTEIELLIDPDDPDLPVPVFPTTRIHARAGVDAALEHR